LEGKLLKKSPENAPQRFSGFFAGFFCGRHYSRLTSKPLSPLRPIFRAAALSSSAGGSLPSSFALHHEKYPRKCQELF
jgi:hypothetical protein